MFGRAALVSQSKHTGRLPQLNEICEAPLNRSSSATELLGKLLRMNLALGVVFY